MDCTSFEEDRGDGPIEAVIYVRVWIDNGENFLSFFAYVLYQLWNPILVLILMPSLLLYSLLVTRFIKKTQLLLWVPLFFPVPSVSSLTPLLPTLVPSFSPKDIDLSLIHIKETRSSFLTSSSFIIFK